MGGEVLSSRAIIGLYFQRLEADPGASWVNAVSNFFASDQASETYPWLGMVPALREWIGERQIKGLRDDSVTILNRHYEASIEFAIKDMRRDKTPQIQARIDELIMRGNTHFASLLSSLILNGAATVCYDGEFFFDTDHEEGSSGSQSNDISTDISALPANVHGSATAPSPEEMQQAILKSISQMYIFKDDQGEPMNEMASSFHVVVPVGLFEATRSALSATRDTAASTFDMEGFSITASVNPRLTSGGWTDQFATFRTDGSIKSLIRQQETTMQMKVKDENSEYAFDNDAVQFGIDGWRNVGYGRWQGAVLNQLV